MRPASHITNKNLLLISFKASALTIGIVMFILMFAYIALEVWLAYKAITLFGNGDPLIMGDLISAFWGEVIAGFIGFLISNIVITGISTIIGFILLYILKNSFENVSLITLRLSGLLLMSICGLPYLIFSYMSLTSLFIWCILVFILGMAWGNVAFKSYLKTIAAT